ncbi:unnamed protein product [Dibothriocephalus latus]|uniref:Reverse transcriptase domain-containing protein n=1 Tax=Dibothriocephalus latus TaxID=60516 RepID=A0A3P7P5G2_DIBLA|nr:unnamed protein product [Dibothriocephalus latus]
MRIHLQTTFTDLTNVFDTVNHDGLWKVMQKICCPECFTHTTPQLLDETIARVTDNGILPTGRRRLFLCAYLLQSYDLCHFDGRLPQRVPQDPHHLRDYTRASTTTVNSVLFADVCVLNTTTERGRQRNSDHYTVHNANFRLTINTDKTVVIR